MQPANTGTLAMHIPDGYLSPATCATMYAGAVPFWWYAFRRMKRALHTRIVPLLSVFAAFSFIVMMFNLPLPGGTTGHAVGVTIASIVLGPWGSIVAVSIALAIQALLFGDGGITAYGANCFNMAIAGSLASYAIYRLGSGGAAISATRRVVAAGVAGYIAINVSALLAAIEFGMQPMLFHDAAGAPLYAPYPLHIAVPAMMIGHLTIAGLAEMTIAAGIVAYLQRANPGLLAASAPGAPVGEFAAQGWRATRPLWVAVGILLLGTPLGILAAGSAWGEWAPEDFRDATARRQISAASAGHAAPAKAPRGMERLAGVWTAPMPRYAPSFLRNPGFGYLLSAMAGTGLVVLLTVGAAAVSRRMHAGQGPCPGAPPA